MTELQAIIGLEQLQQIERYISIRRQQANLYIELLGNCNSIKIPRSNQNIKHIYQTFLIQTIDDKREALQRFLREHGIESSIGAQFLPELGYMPKDINVRKYPIAYDAYSKGLAIPLGPHLSYSDIEYIANIIKEYDQR
jgi:perosamine synthetase